MREPLQKAIDYIDAYVTEPLTLETIANQAGYSKYYMNHLFSIYTGYSIMAYVRKQKLIYGIRELKTDKRVIDIALEIGYASERAFSRAVVKEFGHSPTYFRHHDLPAYRKLVLYDLKLNVEEDAVLAGFPPSFKAIKQNVEAKGVKVMKQYLSDVRYEVINAMTVLSGTAIGNEPEDEIIAVMQRLAEAYDIKPNRQFGFDSPVEGSEDVMQLRGYEFWLAVDEVSLSKLPAADTFEFEGYAISVKSVPTYRYATLRITDPMKDPFERIGTGWQYLVKWLEPRDFKESDFKPSQCVHCLEEVKVVDDVMVMDLFIPVSE